MLPLKFESVSFAVTVTVTIWLLWIKSLCVRNVTSCVINNKGHVFMTSFGVQIFGSIIHLYILYIYIYIQFCIQITFHFHSLIKVWHALNCLPI